jgi:hypothetical protein
MPPDVVFIVKEQVRRPELQYALRSWSLVPHGTVWFVGGKPEWVRGVEHVPFPDSSPKWDNIAEKAKSLATLDGLSEFFYYTEDDYFILQPQDQIPAYTRPETLNDYVADYEKKNKKLSGWAKYLQTTRNVLHAAGVDDPYSFDVHIPLLMEKSAIPVHLDNGKAMSWRSLTGNMMGHTPVPVTVDVKSPSRRHWEKVKAADVGFLSSSEGTFKRSGVQAYLAGLFPDYSPYEKEFHMADSYDEQIADNLPEFESPSPYDQPPKPRVVSRRLRRGKPNLFKLDTGEWVTETEYEGWSR